MDQLELFEKDLVSELKATKQWMGRIQRRVSKLERSLEVLHLVKNPVKTAHRIEQMQIWGT